MSEGADAGPAHPVDDSLAIVVPVRNQPRELRLCIDALRRAGAAPDEIVVVDDASTDDTVEVARSLGVRVVRRTACGGPAAARNTGVRATGSALILFVDADVVVAPDALERVRDGFRREPGRAAVFGSYDDQPAAPGVVSRYRNLLHSYVHQRARTDASTFWTGCGAVRRRALDEVGGFDEARWLNYVEDIEFGDRLVRAGHRVKLDPALLSKHLKRWTLRSMTRTDLLHRALPWSRLMLGSGGLLDDLNVSKAQRLCVVLTATIALALVAAPWQPASLLVAAGAVLAVLALNADLFRFLQVRGGVAFAAACLPLHLVHYTCAGLGFGWAWLEHALHAGPGAVRAGMLARRSGRDGSGYVATTTRGGSEPA